MRIHSGLVLLLSGLKAADALRIGGLRIGGSTKTEKSPETTTKTEKPTTSSTSRAVANSSTQRASSSASGAQPSSSCSTPKGAKQYSVMIPSKKGQAHVNEVSKLLKEKCAGEVIYTQKTKTPTFYLVSVNTEGKKIVESKANIKKGDKNVFTSSSVSFDAAVPVVPRDDKTKTQDDAFWNLARISMDQDGSIEKLVEDPDDLQSDIWDFVYPKSGGEGITFYVVDSGVSYNEDINHNVIERLVIPENVAGKAHDDSDGHGTQVAAILVGRTLGVAKQAKVVSVKMGPAIQGERSATNNVIMGLDMARDHFINVLRKKNPKAIGIINASFELENIEPVKAAVQAAIDAGMYVVNSAGNNGGSKGNGADIGLDRVYGIGNIMVGGSTWQDTRSPSSNYGEMVDVYAPGKDVATTNPKAKITSAAQLTSEKVEDDRFSFETGVSFAVPHVAGGAGLYLGWLLEQGRDASIPVKTLREKIMSSVVKGKDGKRPFDIQIFQLKGLFT